MTHEELLEKLSPARYIIKDEVVAQLNALRAVVELHKPLIGTSTCFQFCEVDEDAEIHKCPTIQAIEKELA